MALFYKIPILGIILFITLKDAVWYIKAGKLSGTSMLWIVLSLHK